MPEYDRAVSEINNYMANTEYLIPWRQELHREVNTRQIYF